MDQFQHLLPEHRAAVARAAQNYFEWYERCEKNGAINEAPSHPDLIELESLGAKYDIVYDKALQAVYAVAKLPDDKWEEYQSLRDGSAFL